MTVLRYLVVLSVVPRMICDYELCNRVFTAMLPAHPVERPENERMRRSRRQKPISRLERHVHIQEHHERVGRVLGDGAIEQVPETQVDSIARFARPYLA